MFKRMRVKENFLKLSREHTIVYDYIAKLEKLLNEEDSDDLVSLAEISQSLGAALDDHMEVEERVLFPAAISCKYTLEMVDLILTLQKEHGYFERDLSRVNQLIQNHSDDARNAIIDIKASLRSLLQDLKEHAETEMKEVFSRMDRDRSCRKIIEGYIIPD